MGSAYIRKNILFHIINFFLDKRIVMNTTIELMANEFNQEAFERIKSFLVNKSNSRISISITDKSKNFPPKETREEYFNRLDMSIKDIEGGKSITFTWDEFEALSKQLLNEP